MVRSLSRAIRITASTFLKYASFGVSGSLLIQALSPSTLGTVPSPTPMSIAWTKAKPLARVLSRMVLASSRVYPRKICHCVVPNQKTGLPFWSTKYLPFSLTLTGKAVSWADALDPTKSNDTSRTATLLAVGFIFSHPFQQMISAS